MIKKNKKIFVKDLGKASYKPTWDYQEKVLKEITNIKSIGEETTPNYFFYVEHPPVYTLGKSGEIKHLLLSEEKLRSKNIEFHKTNRGGDITFHGPGQVVGYPILDLENFYTDIHKYLRMLEEVIILTLKEYGLKGERSPKETGVWLDANTPFPRKICALGVRTSRWVTMHGFAFNVNTDLTYFDNIIPCGIVGKSVTSLKAELKKDISMEEVKEKINKHFQTLFEAEFVQL